MRECLFTQNKTKNCCWSAETLSKIERQSVSTINKWEVKKVLHSISPATAFWTSALNVTFFGGFHCERSSDRIAKQPGLITVTGSPDSSVKELSSVGIEQFPTHFLVTKSVHYMSPMVECYTELGHIIGQDVSIEFCQFFYSFIFLFRVMLVLFDSGQRNFSKHSCCWYVIGRWMIPVPLGFLVCSFTSECIEFSTYFCCVKFYGRVGGKFWW